MKYILAVFCLLNSSMATISEENPEIANLKNDLAKRNNKREAAKAKLEAKEAAKLKAKKEAEEAAAKAKKDKEDALRKAAVLKKAKLKVSNENYDQERKNCIDYIKSKGFKEEAGFESKFKYNLKKHTLVYFKKNKNSKDETVQTFSCKTGTAIGAEKSIKHTVSISAISSGGLVKTSTMTKKNKNESKVNSRLEYTYDCVLRYQKEIPVNERYGSANYTVKNGFLYLFNKKTGFKCPKVEKLAA